MHDRIRELREARGLTQQALAERAGLSRQLVGAMEARRHTPSVTAALAVARALQVSVEDLFGGGSAEAAPVLGDALVDGAPVRAGRVADVLVVAGGGPWCGEDVWWASADGVVSGRQVALFPGAAPAALVVAGCDPMLGALAGVVERMTGRGVLAVHASTGRALDALRAGRVHAAVVHGPGGMLAHRDLGVRRWRLATWRVGLAGSGRSAPSVDEVANRRWRVLQREPGAGAQGALERALSDAGADGPLLGPVGSGHLDVARRVRSGEARAGVTIEAAAVALGLPFTPLEDHEVQLWVDERWTTLPVAGSLVEALATAAFTQQAARVPGYDLSGSGSALSEAE